MNKFSKLFLLQILVLIINPCFSQLLKGFKSELKFRDTIVDPDYGIRYFDKYSKISGDNQVRYCKNYACQGWVEDYYTSDQLMHRGFYNEGILNIFKNYFPDGSLERELKNTSLNKSELTTYYPGKGIRTKSYFSDGNLLKYEEYFENGQLEYLEETHKSMTYYIQTLSYFNNGTPQSTLMLTDPKKLFFSKVEYFENGNPKEKGNLFYNRAHHDYYKTGKWLYYNESGKLTSEVIFENGHITKTINH
jgi:antitoxin component YwqK of YwqJK toxin-antitoxin module